MELYIMKKFQFICIVLLAIFVKVSAQNIKGYYTRLDFNDSGFTGKYADIVIELINKGQFVFSREYSYQPFWQPVGGKRSLVNRLIPRYGEGPEERPDEYNNCSNAAIVNKTDSSVTVHWRYAPDIRKPSFIDFNKIYNEYGNPSAFYTEYADEYFTVKSDGTVRRIAKKGCYRLDEWRDPRNQFTQEFKLTPNGIEQKSLTEPVLSNNYGTRIPNTEIKAVDEKDAILIFNFDEALSNGNGWTTEKTTNTKCEIIGVEDYWEKGISGTGLLLDSYSNAVIFPFGNVPKIEKDFSISVWVAPLEYPFNKAAIIDHLNGNNGYFLGMNRLGEIEFIIGNSADLFEIKTTSLPLYDWTYIVATYSWSQGLKIYLNGKLASNKVVSANISDAANTDISVGMTKSFKQYPYGAERDITRGFQTNIVFSGMIDELMVFGSELKSEKIEYYYNNQKPKQIQHFRPYVLPPDGEFIGSFGANYTQLNFHKTWDGMWRTGEYSDIVVTFEKQPWRYIFWRGTRYLPSLVTDYGRSGIWSNDQSPEVYNGRCYEHMSDMLCRYSNIRLISGSPARVIVHWRNASADIAYRWPKLNDKGQGIWTDEYWTIYPDGTSVRYQLLHNSIQERIIEMNQNEILLHPGQNPEDAIMNEAVIVGNENGDFLTWHRLKEEPGKPTEGNYNVLYTNLNSSTKQFQIGEIGTRIESNLHRDVYWNGWDHYPVQLIPSDGTRANKYDRCVSFCPSTFREHRRQLDDTTIESMQIYGLTRLKPEDLTPLNRSWNFPPLLIAKSGCEAIEYHKAEKAYYLKKTCKKMKFQIMATTSSPLVNPAFIIKNIGGSSGRTEVKINGNKIVSRNGVELDPDGCPVLVIWIEYSSDSSTEFEISIG
jgi:hypothetical protein